MRERDEDLHMIKISPEELYDFLSSKKFKYFFHANTVKTSCTLIRQNGLLSRGEIEARKLPMTPQFSDDIDKRFDVWNDIFLDIVDLHGYFPRQNVYGPVCFKISNEFLLDKNLPNICITKNNPIYWNVEMTEEEKYYSSVNEYIVDFEECMRNNTIQTKMFTIHNTGKRIPFKKYLVEVILDNPAVKVNNVALYALAKEALLTSLNDSEISADILKTRTCNGCFCKDNYLNQVTTDELEKLFKP